MTDVMIEAEERNLFEIPEENLDKFMKQIEKLSKRSEKLIGTPIKPFVFSWEMKDLDGSGQMVKVYQVYYTAETPKLGDYTFVATIDHSHETGNIVRSVPTVKCDLPEHFRTAEPYCQHCKVRRYRRDTYIVRNDQTGELTQVGNSCLRDFLGHDPFRPAKLAELLSYAWEISRACSEPIVGSDRRWIDTQKFLEHCAWAYRNHGWVSASAARQSEHLIATRTHAHTNMFPLPNSDERTEEPSPEDKALAAEALEWIREQKAQNAYLSDYMHNLCVATASDYIEWRSEGIVASLIHAFLRATDRLHKREKIDLGNMLGIITLFEQAKENLQKPAIVLVTKDDKGHDEYVRLSVASEQSKVPGSINVARGARWGGDWFGRIKLDGTYQPSRVPAPAGLIDTLKNFAADPEKAAAEYGRLTGTCCFCHKALGGKSKDAQKSVEVGYGKTCAIKWGRKWGSYDPANPKPKRAKRSNFVAEQVVA